MYFVRGIVWVCLCSPSYSQILAEWMNKIKSTASYFWPFTYLFVHIYWEPTMCQEPSYVLNLGTSFEVVIYMICHSYLTSVLFFGIFPNVSLLQTMLLWASLYIHHQLEGKYFCRINSYKWNCSIKGKNNLKFGPNRQMFLQKVYNSLYP